MAAYRITTDSTVDLNLERMEELGVPFVSLHLMLEGKDILDDMESESAMSLYNAMREGKMGTTSQATVESFLELWEPMLQTGEDILYVGFSSALSGTVNSALIARGQLAERYPDRRILIVDSLCASAGEGMLLEHAVALQKSGLDIDACYQAVEALKLRVNHWFTVDDLTYLRRGGRVSGAAALFATLLSIKPVMDVNNEGKLTPREKVKGRRAAIKRMYEHLCEKIDVAANTFVNISHSDCIADAEYLMEIIKERFPKMSVNIYSVGAVIGSHSGPGTLALFFLGAPRTA